jgi:hypothetical protein
VKDDEYVRDWVGFSLYATPMSNGKEDLRGNIIDSFAPLYERYKHKPIMISEAAVAHTVLPSNKRHGKSKSISCRRMAPNRFKWLPTTEIWKLPALAIFQQNDNKPPISAQLP